MSDLADFVLLGVVVDDRLSVVVESLETLDNGLLVVVDATTRLSAVQQSLLHRLVGHLHRQLSRRLRHTSQGLE